MQRHFIALACRTAKNCGVFEIASGSFGIVAQKIDGLPQIGLGVVEGFAGFADEQREKGISVCLKQISGLFENGSAGLAFEIAPGCLGFCRRA